MYQQSQQQFFCGFGPLLRSKKSPNCAIQLFNVEGDGAMCQSRLTHGLVQPFTRLYNGSWVFAALNQQVPVLMNCPNSTVPTSLLGFGVINLPEGCTLTSDDYYYPHTFTGFSDLEMSFRLEPEEAEAGLHTHSLQQIEPGVSGPGEPAVIAAVEAELEAEAEYYDEYDVATARNTEADPGVTEQQLSEEATTRVSVETSYNVLSDGPEIVENTLDDDDVIDYSDEGLKDNEDGKIDHYIITKADFIKDTSEESSSGEIKISPETGEEATEVHHDVLVKLKHDISQSNDWLLNINNAFRELRKLV